MSEKSQGQSRYAEVYARWQRDPEGFWADAAREIDWIEQPKKIFDPTQGVYGRWFTGGVTNTAYNCLDRHVERGRGNQAALIYDSPVTGQKRIYTYAELLDDVCHLRGRAFGMGVQKGDRVIVYMPMIPNALISMLACAADQAPSTPSYSAVLRPMSWPSGSRTRSRKQSFPPHAGSSRTASWLISRSSTRRSDLFCETRFLHHRAAARADAPLIAGGTTITPS